MKMQHVTILTKYFDEEIKFYEDYAGLKIVRDMRPHIDLVFLADGPEETKVEIIRNPEAEGSGNQFISMGFGTFFKVNFPLAFPFFPTGSSTPEDCVISYACMAQFSQI